MRFYLSSFKLGERSSLLPALYGDRKPVGYCANALDHISDKRWLNEWMANDIKELTALGLLVRPFDLRDFFSGAYDIGAAVSQLSGLWLSGGNVFVLRQAMRLSGLDICLHDGGLPQDFVYGGYSAACCVLSPTLRPYAIADDPNNWPYPQLQETLWEGLGFIDFAFMPHFQSEHSESGSIDMEIAYCMEQRIPYRAFRDGEVLVA